MSRDARAALAAVIVVIAVLILRFLGSPKAQRMAQADLRTVQAMARLAQEIDSRSKIPGKDLPANLGGFPDALKQDPVTHKPFIYRPKSKTEYELCGTFLAGSRDAQPQPNPSLPNSEDRWAHPAGDYCFTIDASQPVPPAPYTY